MIQPFIARLRLALDDRRIRQHFRRVDATLQARDVGHLPPEIRQRREQHIRELRAYAARHVYPRNYKHPGRAPCFIDRNERACAVAHLVTASGHREFAHHIATVANDAYIHEMSFPELDRWASEAGLSKEELALIQPTYPETPEEALGSLLVAIWAWSALAGWVIGAVNAVQLLRKREGILAPLMGGLATAAVVSFALIPTFLDVPMLRVGLFDAPSLILLWLPLLWMGLSFYRAHRYLRAKRTALKS